MGGDIVVAPRRGGGTTFTLTVTLIARRGRRTARRRRGVHRVGTRRRRCALLSVEDNPFGRVVLNTILTELGHQAEFIGQGEAAPSGSRKATSMRC